jgi:Tfp pilus assembly protein PilF
MRKLFSILCICTCFSCIAQTNAVIHEYNKTFTTYPFSDPNPVPSFTKIYPYFRYDGFTDKPVQKEWKVVELENDFIKIMILPEIGGKIWSAIEKSTGRSFFYYNHAVKFRDIALRGPWTSGGLEANYGIMGHTPNCATPVDYTTRENADGSVSCIIGALDLLTNTNWTIEINLSKDKAYFTTKSFWYNNTNLEQPYYHWMNAGLKSKGNLEFVYRGNHYLGHEGEYSEWPVNKQNGKDISFYENNNFGSYKSYHVFGKYTDFFGAYWHDDDFGMARYSSHDDKLGKKIWIWGLSQQGMIWEKLLTDTDGQYVELQSGRLFNQTADKSTYTPFKHKSFSPYGTDTWKEYWYPVLNTKGFVEANEYGALNVKYENGWLKLYFNPAQKIDDTLEVKQRDKIIYNKKIQANPLKTFIDSVKINIDPNDLVITLGINKLIYNSKPDAYDLNRPLNAPGDFDWNSFYGLYIQGKEFCDEKQYDSAESKLHASLAIDHNFLPALVKMAELKYRNMRYTEALQFAKTALSINTNDGGANYYYGIINARLGNVIDAMDGFDMASLSVEYRSEAYTGLSNIYLKQKNWDKALNYASKAISFNQYNIAALQISSIVYRYKDNHQAADSLLNSILSYDPLNHFALFEKYLWQSSEENKKHFTEIITNEQPAQTYLELAISYYDNGCIAESEKVLELCPTNALAGYWKAFLQSKQNSSFVSLLNDADNLSPEFVFPFRSEDEEMLLWAKQQSTNWKPKYYLALLYKARNRNSESQQLFKTCGNEPEFAPFYAARAAVLAGVSDGQALTDLKKAIELNRNEWRYHKLLSEYYIDHKESEKALEIAELFYKAHPNNYIIGMLYAKTLLLNKRYHDCSALLSRINILPFEGATIGRELYHEAELMQAINEMNNKNYTKALSFISYAKKWPPNLGVGKPYQENIDERLEDWISYLCYAKMGKSQQAKLSLQKIIDFKPQIENTDINFFPANELLTAWAIEELDTKLKASEWLQQEVKKYPDNKIIQWCWQVFESGQAGVTDNADSGVRLIEQLLHIKDNNKPAKDKAGGK